MDQSASVESPEVEKFMRLAVNEAKQALSRLEVPLGCVIVQNGEVHYPFWESRKCITVVPKIDLGVAVPYWPSTLMALVDVVKAVRRMIRNA
ncbi:hypothetical protein R1flu_000563 [Riccia fluitans]|uniref:Uncharacterized protein n=1 Tax=Riccia fluitans TaxID=41844 RepID=A0ABD1Y104_9MARC